MVTNNDKMRLIPFRLFFHASRLDSRHAVVYKCHEPTVQFPIRVKAVCKIAHMDIDIMETMLYQY